MYWETNNFECMRDLKDVSISGSNGYKYSLLTILTAMSFLPLFLPFIILFLCKYESYIRYICTYRELVNLSIMGHCAFRKRLTA